jgi:erythrin-vacuolar iron transport family protein
MTSPRTKTTNTRSSPASRGARAALAVFLRSLGLPGMAWRLDRKAGSAPHQDAAASRSFLLRVVQPGLAGLMDGSVSTLAPIFATAFATHKPFTAFLVGMASATGAGISMAFAEALSDTGELTGRGNPWLRGGVTGGMTFLGGSLHTLPFLIANLHAALVAAYVVVAIELIAIAAIRHRFFGTSWGLSMLQVVGGGALVFGAALVFGNA